MKHWKQVTAFALAGVLVVGAMDESWAFGKKFLKDTMKGSSTQEQQTTQTSETQQQQTQPQQQTAQVAGPFEYMNEKYMYKFELPGKWQKMSGTEKSKGVVFSDLNGPKGSFQVNANWMSDDFPVQSSLQAMEKQYAERQKHGELDKFYRKDFQTTMPDGKKVTLFEGYVTVESTEDPDIRRMQWIGYGRGNYYNFTWAATPDQFESYMPEFQQILEEIEFTQ